MGLLVVSGSMDQCSGRAQVILQWVRTVIRFETLRAPRAIQFGKGSLDLQPRPRTFECLQFLYKGTEVHRGKETLVQLVGIEYSGASCPWYMR